MSGGLSLMTCDIPDVIAMPWRGLLTGYLKEARGSYHDCTT